MAVVQVSGGGAGVCVGGGWGAWKGWIGKVSYLVVIDAHEPGSFFFS